MGETGVYLRDVMPRERSLLGLDSGKRTCPGLLQVYEVQYLEQGWE